MKKIQPIQLWVNGSIQTVNYFNLNISYDDLQSSCLFQYQLIPDIKTGVAVGNGSLVMDGNEYLTWDGSNTDAYNYALTKLNLTPIND